MDLCDINQIKALLAAHGFHFSKAKGQNFLTQGWVPARIAEESGVDESCGVLEVGPGIGCLTKELCLRAGKVCAVEVDTSLKPILAQTLGEFDNLSIVYGDVLKLDLQKLVSEQFPDKKPMACANLPYYITSPILSALLESRLFSQVTVMVQKEVAQRICAPAGDGEYSAFSVFCQYYSRPELLFDVPPHCFIPQPKVTSSVIRLTMREEPPCELLDEGYFFRTVRGGFAMRRKTACNALGSAFPKLGKAGIAEVLEACGHAPTVRCETMDIPAFAAIANEIYRREHNV
ncbi:MAG: ribosomal RNA small subunit methyltransferase A [Ruminococcaceae bacterium]|nr:ribosomal RNA small subunit methyltransferase A [Oscillospiraceae bacterium]